MNPPRQKKKNTHQHNPKEGPHLYPQSILDALTESAAIIDTSGQIVLINAVWRRFAEENGFVGDNFGLGTNYLDICERTNGDEYKEAAHAAWGIRTILAGKQTTFQMDYPCHSPNEKRWFVMRASRIDEGERTWLLISHRNITERVKTAFSLRKNEEKYRSLFENLLVGFAQHEMLFDGEGRPKDYRFLEVNQTFEKMTGLTREIIIGKTVLEAIPNLEPFWIEIYGRVVMTGKSEQFEQYSPSLGKHFDALVYPSGEKQFVTIFTDITQRKIGEIEIARRAQQLNDLNQIGQNVVASLDYDQVLEQVINQANQLFNAEGVSILLHEGDELVFIAASGDTASTLKGRRMPVHVGVAGEVFTSGKPTWIHGAEDQGRIYRDVENKMAFRVQSLLAAPLVLGGKIIGVIEAVHSQPNRFNENDLQTLIGVAYWASIAINNARQHQDLHHRLIESQSLEAISQALNETRDLTQTLNLIVDAASKLIVRAERAVIHLLDERGELLHPMAVKGLAERGKPNFQMRAGEGIAGQVIATGKLINTGNIDRDPRYLPKGLTPDLHSLMVAPIQTEAEVLGTISVQSSIPNAFSSDDERLLGHLGIQVALTIKNVRTFEHIRRQVEELTVLHDVAIAISQTDDEHMLMERITHIIGNVLYPDNFGILLLDKASNQLFPHLSYHANEEYPFQPMPLGLGIIGKVAQTGLAIRIGNVSQSEEYYELDPGTQSKLCVPINVQDEIIGVINTESTQLNAFTASDEQLLITLAGQLATALEKLHLLKAEKTARQEAEATAEQLRVREHYLTLLNEITRVASTNLDLNIMLHVLANRGREVIDADTCYITLWDEHRKRVIPAAASGAFNEIYTNLELPLDDPHSATRKILETEKSILLHDIQSSPLRNAPVLKLQDYDVFAVPMIVNERKLGGVFFSFREAHTFTEDEINRGEQTARQIALAISKTLTLEGERKARLEAETTARSLRAREQHLTLLNKITVAASTILEIKPMLSTLANLLREVINADNCFITQWNEDLKLVTPGAASDHYLEAYTQTIFKPGEPSLTSFVLSSGKSKVVEKITDSLYINSAAVKAFPFRDVLAVPMIVDEQKLGAVFFNFETSHSFIKDEIVRAEQAVNHAALALFKVLALETERKARLEAETMTIRLQEREYHLTLLNEITGVASITPDLPTMLRELAERMRAVIDADSVYINLWDDTEEKVIPASAAGDLHEVMMQLDFATDIPSATEVVLRLEKSLVMREAIQTSLISPETIAPLRPDGVLTIPLMHERQKFGAIILVFSLDHVFTEEEIVRCEQTAQKIARSISNLLGGETVSSFSRPELENLLETPLHKAVAQFCQSIGAECLFLNLRDEKQQKTLPFVAYGQIYTLYTHLESSPGEVGLTKIVLDAGHRLAIEDTRNNPSFEGLNVSFMPSRAVLAIPLIVEGKRWGAVLIVFHQPHQFTEDEITRSEQAAGQVGLAIAKAQTFEAEKTARKDAETTAAQLREREHHLTQLNEITRTASATLELAPMLQALVQQLKNLINSDSAFIALWDEHEQKAIPVVTFGYLQERYATIELEPGEATLTEAVIRAEHSIAIEDVSTTPYISSRIKAMFPTVSMLGIPIITDGKKLGAAHISFNQKHVFIEDEISRCEQAVAHIALALAKAQAFEGERNARLHAETTANRLRARERHLTILNDITRVASVIPDLPTMLHKMANRLREVIDADSAYLTLWDERQQNVIPAAASGDLNAYFTQLQFEPDEPTMTRAVLALGHSFAVENLLEINVVSSRLLQLLPFRGMLGIPLMVEGKTWGAALVTFHQPHVFSDDEIFRSEQAAGQIALAIAKAYVFEAERQGRQKAETLRQLSQVISSNLEVKPILETVLIHLNSVITYDQASIFLLTPGAKPVIASIVGLDLPEVTTVYDMAKTRLRDNLIIQKMAITSQPVLLQDVDQDPNWTKVPGSEMIRSYLGIPLISRGEVFGILNLDSFQPNHFSETDIKLASDLTWHVSVAIDNAQLYENLQRQLQMLQQTQSQLVQNEKLAALGELVAGVAHELNNPLTSIIFYSQLLQRTLQDPQIHRDLESIVSESKRAASIVRNLRDFARQSPPERKLVQVNDVIRSSMELISYELRSNHISWRIDLSDKVPSTLADITQLQQVLINLINNARQAMYEAHEEGVLLVKTEFAPPWLPGAQPASASVIRITVQDNGPGIPEDILPRIFDPFFTTKPTGDGTGLGLSVCHGIITEHQGHIWAQNNITLHGEFVLGTTFIIELPVLAPDEHPAEISPLPAPKQENKVFMARILLLDDEKSVREVLARMLRRHGFYVDALDDGYTGLAQLAKGDYDLIVSDIRMGNMSGIEFFRKLEVQFPNMTKRILFITGDTVSPKTSRFLDETNTPYLSKPFEMADLIATLEGFLKRIKNPK